MVHGSRRPAARIRLLTTLLACLALTAALARPCTAQASQADLAKMDREIQYLQSLLDSEASGNFYLAPMKDYPDLTIAFSKVYVSEALANNVLMGRLSPSDIATYVSLIKRNSDFTVAGLKRRLMELRLARSRLTNQPPPTRVEPPPRILVPPTVKPPPTVTPGGRAKGWFQLKGAPEVTANNRQDARISQRVEFSGNTVTITFRETNVTTGRVIEEWTMNATFDGLGKTIIEAGEVLKLSLTGSWTFSTDRGIYSSVIPQFDYRFNWVTVTDAQPRHTSGSAAENAQLWLGRMTSGTLYLNDHRDVTLTIAKSGSRNTDYEMSLNCGAYGRIVWKYNWIEP